VTSVLQGITKVGDWLTAPFGDHAGWALATAAVLFGVVALLLFKVATNQRGLATARTRLIGRLYEAALYQTNLGVIMRVQGGVLVANLRYLMFALPAIVVLVVPLLIVLPQLEARFGRRPLDVGETTLVTVALNSADQVELKVDPGLVVEAGPVRDQWRGETVWRVRAVEPGEHAVVIIADGETETLAVPVSISGLPALTQSRHARPLDQFLHDPAGRMLSSDGVTRLSLALPGREVAIVGVVWPWLAGFTIISLLAGLLLKSRLRVEI